MPTVRKTMNTTVKRTAGKVLHERMATAAVPKAATKTPTRLAADPTGRVMTRLRGSLGKDYRLDT